MEEKQLKKTFREELKDLTKTVNRLYEDRELLLKLVEKVDNIEYNMNEFKDRVWKLERNLRADLADHKEELEKTAISVEGAISEVKEAIGGGDNENG